MTPERRRDFETEWPILAGRLSRMLARRGVPEARRDDVVQETAVRLYGCWATVDRGRPAWPLAKTIALNYLRDQARRRIKEVPTEIPEVPHRHSVEDAGLARLELGQVRAAMDELSTAARAALLVEVGGTGSPGTPTPAAEKMQRMRARRKLRALLEKVPAALSLRLARLSDIGEWLVGIRGGLAGGIPCFACAALGFSALVPGTVTDQPLVSPERNGAATKRVVVAPETPTPGSSAVGLSVTAADEIREAATAIEPGGSGSKAEQKKASASSAPPGDGEELVPTGGLPMPGSASETTPALPEAPHPPAGGPGEDPSLPPPPEGVPPPSPPTESMLIHTVEDVLEAVETL